MKNEIAQRGLKRLPGRDPGPRGHRSRVPGARASRTSPGHPEAPLSTQHVQCYEAAICLLVYFSLILSGLGCEILRLLRGGQAARSRGEWTGKCNVPGQALPPGRGGGGGPTAPTPGCVGAPGCPSRYLPHGRHHWGRTGGQWCDPPASARPTSREVGRLGQHCQSSAPVPSSCVAQLAPSRLCCSPSLLAQIPPLGLYAPTKNNLSPAGLWLSCLRTKLRTGGLSAPPAQAQHEPSTSPLTACAEREPERGEVHLQRTLPAEKRPRQAPRSCEGSRQSRRTSPACRSRQPRALRDPARVSGHIWKP